MLTWAFPQQVAKFDSLRHTVQESIAREASLQQQVQNSIAREVILQEKVHAMSALLRLFSDDIKTVIESILEAGHSLEESAVEALCALANSPTYSVYTSPDAVSVVLPQTSGLPLGQGLVDIALLSAHDFGDTALYLVDPDGAIHSLAPSVHPAQRRKLVRSLYASSMSTTPTPHNNAASFVLEPRHLDQISDAPLLGAHVAQYTDPGLLPYSAPSALPRTVPAAPKRRSVLFARNCYYNFHYLAKALRNRGWDAMTLSTEPEDSDTVRFSHGSDIKIYHDDPTQHRQAIEQFYTRIPERFGIFHTYGVFALSLLPNCPPDRPWDIIELKRHRVLIGYSHSGCLDGIRQSTFRKWSGGMCDKCAWRDQESVCSDERNAAWGNLVTRWADLYCSETDPLIDFKAAPSVFRAPLTFAMNEDVWRPDLDIPEDMKIAREDNEVLIYHAVGNFKMRSVNGENVKGTGQVLRAIERLKSDGLAVRLAFFDNIPSTLNRFAQVQADIIVDQLRYGRYGALAREGMMLGKPVVGCVNKEDAPGIPATQCIQETPIVHATTNSVYDVLKRLVLNPQERAEIGVASRQHAVKWWAADVLAERFERVYDYIDNHGTVPPESLVDVQ